MSFNISLDNRAIIYIIKDYNIIELYLKLNYYKIKLKIHLRIILF